MPPLLNEENPLTVKIPLSYQLVDLFDKFDKNGFPLDSPASPYLILWRHNCNTKYASCLSLGCPAVKLSKRKWEQWGIIFKVPIHECKQGRFCDTNCPKSCWRFTCKNTKYEEFYDYIDKGISKLAKAIASQYHEKVKTHNLFSLSACNSSKAASMGVGANR